MSLGPFVEPPWFHPLDADAELASIPAEATIAGMFFLGLIEGAKQRKVSLAVPRQRYVPFQHYPVAEFAPLLVEAARLFHPGLPLRQGLRHIGAVGPTILAASMLGKVTLGSVEGVHAITKAIAATYSANLRSAQCSVLDTSKSSMRLALSGVHYFLDCHHVGVFEGTLRFAGVQNGRVTIASKSRSSAELLLEW